MKTRRESGDKVSLVYDKLRNNNDIYQWDDETNDVALTRPHSTTLSQKKKKTGSRKAGNMPSAQRARSKITFSNINASSIVRKTDFLEALLLGIEPGYVALTETWLTIDIRDAEITPPNYVIMRKDQPTHGGGVALLIKKEIPYISVT